MGCNLPTSSSAEGVPPADELALLLELLVVSTLGGVSLVTLGKAQLLSPAIAGFFFGRHF
jgi:hypothetical protein